MKVIILMGSDQDKDFVKKIIQALKVPYKVHIASAHKQPKKVLAVIAKYNKSRERICYITVAGRSNALSGVVAAQARQPVIACPPFKDKHDYLINIHSTLQMPSQVPVLTIIDPANAALAAERILKL